MDEELFEPDYIELADETFQEPVKKKRKRSKRTCLLCPAAATHLKPHMYRKHLPWYFAGDTACWQCEVQEGTTCFLKAKHSSKESHPHGSEFTSNNLRRWVFLVNGVLHVICYHLGVDTLNALLQHVLREHLYPEYESSSFLSSEVEILKLFEEENDLPVSEVYIVSPPNSIASLLHWRTLMIIMNVFVPSTLCVLATQDKMFHFSGIRISDIDSLGMVEEVVKDIKTFADSHFHLDLLLKRTGHSSFDKLEASFGNAGYNLQFGVANYVYPAHWDKVKDQVGSETRIGVTFGLHPHLVRTSLNQVDRLKDLLTMECCVGFGEVGLDYTATCRCYPKCVNARNCRNQSIAEQKKFLVQNLHLAKYFRKTLVLHCRDHGNGSAASDVLNILHTKNLTKIPIHRHCFSGTEGEAKQWINELPNCYFGFTSMLLRNKELQRCAKVIPLSKILLESDAPYLPIEKMETNTPWRTIEIAKTLCEVKDLPLDMVLEVTRSNSRKCYRRN